MKKLLALLWLLPLALFAQTGTLLSDEQQQSVMSQIAEATAKVQQLQCQFTQTKSSTLLAEPAVSKGRMEYSRPDRLRWEYTEPRAYAIVTHGDSIAIDGSTQKPNRNASRMMKGISNMIMGSVSGDRLFDQRLFNVQIYDNGQSYEAVMTPKRKEMQRMFQTMTMRFDKQRSTIRSVLLTEKSGDSTLIEFTNMKTL